VWTITVQASEGWLEGRVSEEVEVAQAAAATTPWLVTGPEVVYPQRVGQPGHGRGELERATTSKCASMGSVLIDKEDVSKKALIARLVRRERPRVKL